MAAKRRLPTKKSKKKSKKKPKKTPPGSKLARKVQPGRRKANFTVLVREMMHSDKEPDYPVLRAVADGLESTQDAERWIAENGARFGDKAVFRTGNLGDPIELKVETITRTQLRLIGADDAPPDPPADTAD